MPHRSADSWLLKATLLLVSTLTVMAGATIAPALPTMQDHFAEVNNVALWTRLVLTTPALFIVIGSPVAGQLVDGVGRKPMVIGAALLYGLAGSSGVYLNSLFLILAGRALLGLAVAGIMVSATTLIADYYQGDERAMFMGLQAGFMGFGGVLFLTLGGFVADISWRLPFLIYLFAWLLLPALIWVLYEPQRDPAPDPTAGVSPAALPAKLLILIYAAAVLMQTVFYLIPVQLPYHLRQLTGASASQSGVAIALSTFFSAFASLNYGRLKQRLSFIRILALSFGLMGLGYLALGWASSYSLVLLALAPAGVGLGLLMPNLSVWTSSEVPPYLRGRALGGLTTFFFLGQFLSPIASQPVSSVVGLAATYGLAGALLVALGGGIWGAQKQLCRLVNSTAGQS